MGHGRARAQATPSLARPMGIGLPRLAAALPVVAWTMAGFVATAAAATCPVRPEGAACPAGSSPTTELAAPIQAYPTTSETLPPDARPPTRPRPTHKPKPTTKPKATPAPTPKPALLPAPRPTAAPVAKPAAPATPRRSAAGSVVPAVGVTSRGPLDGAGGAGPDDPLGAAGMIIAITAAAAGCLLVGVAMRRMRSEAFEASIALATPGIIEAETPSPPVTVRPAASSEPTEAHLPRWLRPSVRASRSEWGRDATPTRERVPLAFAAPADEEIERLLVRYDVVPLLDQPDEALGLVQEELDWGDEVEILEREGTWACVRTPTGKTGWIPAMTLTSAAALTDEQEAEERTAEIDGGIHRDDSPTLETLLAMAAQQRAQLSGESPVTDEPRDPSSRSRPGRTRKRTVRRLRSSPIQRP